MAAMMLDRDVENTRRADMAEIDRNVLETVMQTGGELDRPMIAGNYFPEAGFKVTFGKNKPVTEKEIVALLEKAVADSIRGHDGVAVLLSGGVDSSLLLTLIRKVAEPDTRVVAYHTNWHYPLRDESSYARLMAKFNNVEYREVDVRPSEQVAELGRSLGTTKTVDYSITAVCMCFRAIHEDGFKVAANALGIDELFAGYGIHRGTFARMKGHIPHMVPCESMKVGGKYTRGAARMYGTDAAYFTSNIMYSPYRTIVKDIERYNPRVFYSMSKEDNLWNTVQRWTLVQMIGFYTGSISRAGKASGVEVLFPFHDQDLVQTCMNVPPADKYNKKPIRSLMQSTYKIPAEIAQRGAKWDKLAWGGTILPYLDCKDYMKEATSNSDVAADWFEDWAAGAFMKNIGRTKTRLGFQMLLFTRMLQELK